MYHLAKANRISKQERRVKITTKDLGFLKISQMEKMKVRNRRSAERRKEYFK